MTNINDIAIIHVASTYDVVSTYDVARKTLFSGKGFVFFLAASFSSFQFLHLFNFVDSGFCRIAHDTHY